MTTTSRAEYTRHPLSNPFGDAAPHDFEALVQSMKVNGFMDGHPVILYEGRILDGFHRYKAAKEVGVAAVFTEFSGTLEQARQFILSENVARRHLTVPQKILIYQLNNEWLPKHQRLTDVDICKMVGRQSLQLANQLRRLALDNPEEARKVAYQGKSMPAAIKEVLKERAKDGNGNDQSKKGKKGVFVLNDQRLLERLHVAWEKSLLTETRMVNKAFTLFSEWVDAGMP